MDVIEINLLAVIRGMYLMLSIHCIGRLLHAASQDKLTKWNKMLLYTTCYAMIFLMINQITAIITESSLIEPSHMLIKAYHWIGLLTMSPLAILVMMLTSHAIMRPWVYAMAYIPLLTVIFFHIFIDDIAVVCSATTMLMVLIVGIICFRLYRKYQKALLDNYSNIEGYDLNWLVRTIILVFSTAFIRMMVYAFNMTAITLLMNILFMLIWYYMCHKVLKFKEAYAVGIVSSPILSQNDYETEVTETSDNNILGEQIRTVCMKRELMGNTNFNTLMLAHEVGCDRRAITHYFNSTNTTFYSYINDIRLEMAAQWLRTTEDSVLEISQRVGFRSDNTFRLSFQTKYGCSPVEYRSNVNRK